MKKEPYNEHSMRRKIAAQLNTLKENKIRHVVLSAFGCGAFLNPAEDVAQLYKEELFKRMEDFDEVVFAIYHAGYGTNNYLPFQQALAPLCKPKHLIVPEDVLKRPVLSTFNMQILGLFTTVLGVTAVALAFALLNAATGGTLGIVLGVAGAILALTGIGFFAKGAVSSPPIMQPHLTT